MTARYPAIPPHLHAQLKLILPSLDPSTGIYYYPCRVTLKDGSFRECVYLVEAANYARRVPAWPEDLGAPSVSIGDVKSIAESPFRLPAACANAVYEAGESGMGITIFTVVFGDGSQYPYVAGGGVDFIDYPEGKTVRDVKAVLPGAGREKNPRRTKDFYWCLFSLPGNA